MKGYKVFDENWKCKGTDYEYQYSLGGRFKHEGEIKLCGSGFHFCEKLIDCFNYKKFNPKNKQLICFLAKFLKNLGNTRV